jgi:hypothetical protein
MEKSEIKQRNMFDIRQLIETKPLKGGNPILARALWPVKFTLRLYE